MRIGIITNGYPTSRDDWRGAFAYDFAHTLHALGHDVFIFTPDREGAKENSADVPATWFPWAGDKTSSLITLRFLNPLHLLRMFSLFYNGRKQILTFVASNNIEFCLALWALPSGLFAQYAYRRLHIPYAVWCLGSDIWIYAKYPLFSTMTKSVLANARIRYADGLQLLRDVQKIYPKECLFLPTTRKLPKPKPLTHNGKKNFLFVGRLEMVKGIDILIQSWKSLPAEYKDTAHLSIFGTGTLESFVRKEIQGEASLSFHGMAKPQDVADYGSMCDWMVIPSRNESIPVIFSDAMQLHLPVIVSDVGDMGDLVRDNSIGHIVQPGDTQSLQDALLKGMTEETDYSTYKHNTEIVSQKFSVHESVRQFMENVRSYR